MRGLVPWETGGVKNSELSDVGEIGETISEADMEPDVK